MLNATGKVENNGLLASAETLTVNSTFDIVNYGLFGAKIGLNLTASEGDIYNFANATLHSEGETHLSSKNKVYNLGEIYSDGTIYVNANILKNDVSLTGQVKTKTEYKKTTFSTKKARGNSFQSRIVDTYEIGGDFLLLDGSDIKIQNIGRIYSGKGLEFKVKDKQNSVFLNRGFIKVNGELSYDSKRFVNSMESLKVDPYKALFDAPINLTLAIKTNQVINSITTYEVYLGENTYQFGSIGGLIDHIFDGSFLKSGNNYPIVRTEALLALGHIDSYYLRASLYSIFGANWPELARQEKVDELRTKWRDFVNHNKKMIDVYPSTKAKILVDRLSSEGKESHFENGANYEFGKSSQNIEDFNVGKHTIKVPELGFTPFINKEEEQNGVDLSTLLELLAQPQLFIDKSGYREPPKEIKPEFDQEDKDLLGDYDKERKHLEEQRRQAEQKRLLEEHKRKQKQLTEEEKRRLKEYEKTLEEERRREEELNRKREIPERNLPEVETDALYRTRLHYINQNDYIGSKYFFDKIAPRDGKLKEAKVLGDNYFEHQFITRSIEKKVENHLSLKYNLSDIELVKKLMDNAYFEAKDLGLTLGQAPTKEQQESLKEDIIWYVKTNVNGQEVFVPQVYFAKHTLENAEKFRGVGDAVIRARELNVKAKDIQNSGTIAGDNLNLEAENKITNSGDILSKNKARLVGKKGIESTGETFLDEQGNTQVRKSRIKSYGHLYLETDKDSNVDLTASEISGKTGQIKTKNLNLNDTYKISQNYSYKEVSDNSASLIAQYQITESAKAESVGSDANFEHLHLSVEGDVNQNGSNLKTKRLTGVVKGDYNTRAGKTFTHQEDQSRTKGTELSASVSGGGVSTGVSLSTEEGAKTFTTNTTSTSANAEVAGYVKDTINRETTLTHQNSELEAQSGELYVLNKADIGGVDINKDVATPKADSSTQAVEKDKKSAKAEKQENADKLAKSDEKSTASDEKKAPTFHTLSDDEIAKAFEEKGQDFFDAHKEREVEDQEKGFTLSANRIDSTKAKDEKETYSFEQKVSVGAEAEAHSAVADAASNIARQVRDTENGVKQDATAALQAASDAANLATGDLAGGSGKFKVSVNTNEKRSTQTAENRNILGGKTNLEARGGDLTLNNVESTEDSQLSLRAKDNVNVNAGESNSQGNTESLQTKVTAGGSVSCGAMAGGCSAGVNAGVSGSYTESEDKATSYNNSLLKGRNLSVEAGQDFNLIGSNVDVDHLYLDVDGKTNITSKQDTYSRKERGVNYSVSGGAGVSTSMAAKPNGSVGAGVTVENEESKKVKQQAGISADKITGQINDLNLAGAYFENRQGIAEDFRVKGNVTAKTLTDTHHKDGGSFGGSAGVSETGITQLNVNGGRVEQKHYEALQHSTLSGIKTDKPIEGEVKSDRSQAKEIIRDDTFASTNFSFEVMDLVETGKRIKDKAKNKSRATSQDDTPSAEPLTRRPSDVADDVEAIPDIIVTRRNSVDSLAEGDYTDVETLLAPRSTKSRSTESDYEDISEFAQSTPAPKAKANTEKAEGVEEPIYAKVNKNPEAIAEANAKADEAAQQLGIITRAKPQQEVDDTPPALPPRNFTQQVEGDYAEADAVLTPRATKSRAVESGYEDISEFSQSTPAPKAKVNTEKAEGVEEPIYAKVNKNPEAIAEANAKADEAAQQLGIITRAKPQQEVDDTPPALPPRNFTQQVEGDYAEADAVLTPRGAKSRAVESGYEDISEFSQSTPAPKAKANTEKAEGVEEPIYAKVNKNPEAIAEANAKADEAAQQLGIVTRVKPQQEVDDTPPALPPRLYVAEENASSNDNNMKHLSQTSLVEKTNASAASLTAEKLSFFQKVKNFFTGSKTPPEKKSEKGELKSLEANTKPNYDDLEDSLNLKGLLALENKRNESFEQKVLKNEEFLGEARELAKKLVPESVIKQMGDSPELDEILTGGAKKVEKRINDALTFQPKAEEFAEIQQLVKRLPKGEAIDSIEEKTKRITEALAETSKTIQRNPKLQEEIEGAIGDFLKRSQNEELTVDMIEKLNYGLRPDEGEGRELYKKETLTKENAVFSSPASSKIQLAETVAFINQAKASGVEPSVLAGLVYQRLIAYHPFAEGNGRMARVLVNKLLLDAGYPAFTKFNEKFETQIIPQTEAESKSATSSEVITEFLKELSQKPLPQKTSGDSAVKNTPENVSAGDSTITGRISEVSAEVTTEKAAILSSEHKAETEAVQLTPRAAKSEETPQLKQAKTETAEVESEEALPTTYTKATQPIEAGVEMDLPNDVVQKPTPVSDRVKNRELVEQPRALLDKIKDTFQPLKVGGKIKDVRDSATEYGGEVSFPFAQSKGEVYKQIIKHAETQNGVCESTCAHWIAKKVQDDQSLWNELYNGGTKAGKLNQEAIDSIKKLQSEFINAGSATQQFKLTEEWLSEKGVIAKQRKVGDFSRKDEVSGTVSSKNVDALVKAILDTGEQSSGIKKISINLKGGSHTVSASVEGNKVVFFDPNFGEITFPSHDKFEAWIKNAFWQKSGYAGNDDSKRFFNVVNYHKDK